RPLNPGRSLGQKAHNCERGNTLAASGLPHNPKGLSRANGEIHVVNDSRFLAGPCTKGHREVRNLKQTFCGIGHEAYTRGQLKMHGNWRGWMPRPFQSLVELYTLKTNDAVRIGNEALKRRGHRVGGALIVDVETGQVGHDRGNGLIIDRL